MTGLETTVERAGEHPVLRVAGEVDLANADALAAAVGRALGDAAGMLVVDLADLTYIDSAGLAALHRSTRQVEDRGGGVVLVVPDASPCAHTFAVAALDWPVTTAWPATG